MIKVYVAYAAPVLACAVILALLVRFRRELRGQHHDPIEYYSSSDGYQFELPLRLIKKIKSGQAEALAASGGSYYVAYYRADGRLIRVVKMLRGKADFEHVYAYSPSGQLLRAAIRRPDGDASVLGCDKRVALAGRRGLH
jgi:hypothetical protein